jgi:hypothetical protein
MIIHLHIKKGFCTMNRLDCFREKWIVWMLAGLFFIFTISPSGSAWAQRKPPPRHGTHSVKYGKVVNVLPPGHRVVTAGKVNYHYGNGLFYRPQGRNWVVVRGPIGAVVAGLTAAAILVTVCGITYYLCNGTYYKKVPAGYEVVEAPEPSVTVPVAGEKVRVTAHLLNVRSGPGKHHSVIRQVSEGNILIIRGHAPNWLYVELDDGKMGWVMEAYTTTIHAPALG